MPTYQVLQVLIFLIPGFITVAILDMLVERKEKTDLSKIIEALAFTLIIFTIYSVLFGKNPIEMKKLEEDTFTYVYNTKAFIWLIAVSTALPILLSVSVTYDTHMRFARTLKLTKKTARTTVWIDVFYDINEYIIINFKDERRICGWPRYFSLDLKEPYIFLEDPKWIREETFYPIEVEGILITPKMEIESIEFMTSDNA